MNAHGDSSAHGDGPQPQHSPGLAPPLPADPSTNSETGTRTHPGETPADPQPRTRALPRRAQTPPSAVTAPPPHPAAATCARPARQASAGPITGCCWGAAPARRSRRLHGPRAAPCRRPQRARAWGVAAPTSRAPPPTPAPPGLRGPGQSGSTHFPGPALAARGRCRARTPLFVNKPARPLRHLRSRTLSASRPATPAQGRWWGGGRGEREARRGDAARPHCSPSALPPPPPGSPPGLANRGQRGLGVRTLTPGA